MITMFIVVLNGNIKSNVLYIEQLGCFSCCSFYSFVARDSIVVYVMLKPQLITPSESQQLAKHSLSTVVVLVVVEEKEKEEPAIWL